MVERHGDVAELREALLRRHDLPTCVRIDLVAATASALADFVAGRNWMSDERIARVAREAKDRAAIVISDSGSERSAALELVAHLRQAGQLTVGFVLRAILSGKTELFRASLADLSGLPLARVDGFVENCESAGFAALYRKAALPIELLPAFRIALRAAEGSDWTPSNGAGLSRTVIERVLTSCAAVNDGDLDRLIVLLRRFEAEAARDEARQPPAIVAKTPLLALQAASARDDAPLLLTDFDALQDEPTSLRGRRRAPRIEPSLFIDMDAIAAELRAA